MKCLKCLTLFFVFTPSARTTLQNGYFLIYCQLGIFCRTVHSATNMQCCRDLLAGICRTDFQIFKSKLIAIRKVFSTKLSVFCVFHTILKKCSSGAPEDSFKYKCKQHLMEEVRKDENNDFVY